MRGGNVAAGLNKVPRRTLPISNHHRLHSRLHESENIRQHTRSQIGIQGISSFKLNYLRSGTQ